MNNYNKFSSRRRTIRIASEVAQNPTAKDAHKRNMAKDKRIIVDSIKEHLIPHVSAFKTPKEVYDALTKMFEGKNINWKMSLRNQLKNV